MARAAFTAGVTAHQLRQILGDCQTKTGATVLTRGAGVRLLKGVEEFVGGIRRDANPRILDFESDPGIVRRLFLNEGSQRHLACRGEFDGIACIVEQGLSKSC